MLRAIALDSMYTVVKVLKLVDTVQLSRVGRLHVARVHM